MPAARTIPIKPALRNSYVIDANFLAARYIPPVKVTDPKEQQRITRAQDYWVHMDAQLLAGKAIVYVPDVCIAEAFKTLARKYYHDHYFKWPAEYKAARDSLTRDIRISPRTLKAMKRTVRFHDISTSRDIIIAMDRFYEVFIKHNLSVSVPDLIILATAKFLIDFYNIPSESLYIVTMDNQLWKGTKKFPDIPSAFNPNAPGELAAKVFH